MRGLGIGCTLLRATDDGSAFPREADQDEKVARAKALIKKVQSTPKGRRGGEKRAAEQRNTGGGQAEDGVLAGDVVAVTGNFEKTREEVQGRVKDQNAIYSGTVRCVDVLGACVFTFPSRGACSYMSIPHTTGAELSPIPSCCSQRRI